MTAVSPADVRQWRKLAQQRVRSSLNGVANARVQWQMAHGEGRAAAKEIANTHLSIRYLKSSDLGDLSDLPHLLSCATRKLQAQQSNGLALLAGAHKMLVDATSSMQAALAEGFEMESSLTWNHECNAGSANSSTAINNDKAAGEKVYRVPLFSCLSLASIESLAAEILNMYHAELKVKRQIVLDMEELVNAKGDTLVDPTGSPIDIQQRMEVCVTTWMIEPQINTSRLDEIMLLLEDDMKDACY
mmetsp:Transcript_24861/g.47166  ORF Transcript_24861/g.47166 Transcript_24861/m.47166 type:complete len:245 (+) Transcript_24861:92-826(+)